MPNLYDIIYGLLIALGSPYWLLAPTLRRKVLTALRQRMGHVARRDPGRAAIMIHAVSLGEMNATRELVKMLQQQRPDLHAIVSTTTATGYARGRELYGWSPDVTLIRYPLDFTAAVLRVIGRLRPQLVILLELELWPNFMRQCTRLGIPVILVNGRLTEESFERYRRARPLLKHMFARLRLACVQDATYARRFAELGVPRDRIQVTGTMKFDTAHIADRIDGDEQLAAALGLKRGVEPIWVCGSTGPGEEEIVLRVYRALLTRLSRLRLVIVPRKPERFDEVARLIEQSGFTVLRRSKKETPPLDPPVPAVILGDTMGELRKFYSLADVVFVGRSLVDLGPRQHGSDMIEPAALGKPILVGTFTHNFAEAMRKLREADAVVEVSGEHALEQGIRDLLSSSERACEVGRGAQEVVRRGQGATGRHVELILQHLDTG